MHLACCQFDIAWEDKPANYRRVAALVREAKLPPDTLLLLPEMFATGFTMNVAATAEPLEGPTARFLSDLAKEHNLFVVGGAVVTDAATGKPRNEALTFDPRGQLSAHYAKVYPFSLSREHEHHAAGERVVPFDWAGGRVSPAVCYDLRFPELFRRSAGEGAEVLPVIANWPVTREAHWTTLLRARAIENQAYAAGCNRTGKDGNALVYSGRSQIIDFRGDVLADAGGEETVISAPVDLPALRDYRRSLPFLADMRR
jgi:predicted amidohydrolase